MTKYLSQARAAAVDSYGQLAVGEFSHTVQEEQDGVLSYLFQSKLKGYPDWLISVTLFIDGWESSVSEVGLTPGDTSLVAPKWGPWSERLADYKALQAALEAEAAAAAALAAEDGDDGEDVDDTDESDESDDNTDELVAAELNESAETAGLAPADVPETPEAQNEADGAGGKAQGLFKWKTLRGKKKHK